MCINIHIYFWTERGLSWEIHICICIHACMFYILNFSFKICFGVLAMSVYRDSQPLFICIFSSCIACCCTYAP